MQQIRRPLGTRGRKACDMYVLPVLTREREAGFNEEHCRGMYVVNGKQTQKNKRKCKTEEEEEERREEGKLEQTTC